jgi:predicted ATPase/DNA-binding CsgD family transcriptional regulator
VTGKTILPLTEILGRDDDVASLGSLVSTARLVTITGLGGLGKTRIARELVRRSLLDGHDAAFVDLSPVLRPDLVPARIAAELGVQESVAEPPQQTVMKFLSDRQFLLALDSFEHVLTAAPLIRELLESCPELSVVVTSRIALRIAGEREYPLGPLALPTDDRWEEVSSCAAGTLFIREAERIGSSIGPGDATAIAAICRDLGGLPLGLELAAARTRLFSPAVLADRLHRDLPTLPRTAGGPDDALSTVLGWTVALLDELDRDRFFALAVLPGQFDLATAAVLWDEADPLELLDTLLRLGLVRRATNGEDGRMELLAPVREYARRHLHAAGDEPEAMQRLSAWVGELASRVGPTLRRHGQADGIRTIGAEIDTIHAVLDWQATLDPPAAAEIVVVLEAYWTRTAIREGHALALSLLGRPRVDGRLAALLLDIIATAELHLVGPDTAIEHAAMMVDIAERIGDQRVEMRARFLLGAAHGLRGEPLVAIDQLQRAAALAQELSDPTEAVRILGALGVTYQETGDLDRATAALSATVDQARIVGDDFALAMSLSNYAETLLLTGNIDEADIVSAEAAPIHAALGPTRFTAFNAMVRAGVAIARHEVSSAAALLAAAAQLLDAVGGWEDQAILFDYASSLRVAQERPREAARLLGAAARLREAAGQSPTPGSYITERVTMVELERTLGRARLVSALDEGKAADPVELVRELVRVVPQADPRLHGRYGRLSGREVEVLRLVADGATDADIAEALTISPKTASVHVSNLRTKLGADSRIELAMAGRQLLAENGGSMANEGRPASVRGRLPNEPHAERNPTARPRAQP